MLIGWQLEETDLQTLNGSEEEEFVLGMLPQYLLVRLPGGRFPGAQVVGAGRLPSDAVLQEPTRGYLLDICASERLHGFMKRFHVVFNSIQVE